MGSIPAGDVIDSCLEAAHELSYKKAVILNIPILSKLVLGRLYITDIQHIIMSSI